MIHGIFLCNFERKLIIFHFMDEYPLYLYHYTTIETLALILKNKTIRLKRLDLVDDPEEPKTEDYGELGRFCFVSCWTNMEEESIPMWKLYAGKEMKGVRIKLPTFILQKHILNSSSDQRHTQNGIIHDEHKIIGENFYSYINPDYFFNIGCMTPPIQESILVNVEYTNNPQFLYPKVASYNENKNSTHLNTGIIGKYKHKYWEFQQELRYKIFVCPWGTEEVKNTTSEGLIQLFNRLKYNKLEYEYIDMKMDEAKFEDMTIRLSPKATHAERIIIESLLKEHNPKAKIEESNIKIR